MAEEKDRLSNELMNSIREQRKLRRQDIRRNIVAGIGGAAETFRTGQSAKSVFDRLRPDYSSQMMDKREKMKRSSSILDKAARREEYVFGKATQDAQQRALIDRENRNVQDLRERDQAARTDSATKARQKAKIAAKNTTVTNNYKDLKNLDTPSESAKARFADMPTYEERLRQEAEADYDGKEDFEKENAKARHGTREKAIQAMMRTPGQQAKASENAKRDAKARLESMAATNPQDKDMVWAMGEASKKAAANPSEIHQSLDVNTRQKTMEAEQNHAEDIENINQENAEIDGSYGETGSTLSKETGDPTLEGPAIVGRKVMGSAEREAGKIYAAKLEKLEDIDREAGQATGEDITRINEQLEGQLSRMQEEQTAGIGEEGGAAPQTGFLGFSDIKKPAGGSQAHFRALLEVIDKYPESPPAQHAKQQIVNTQDFKNYQKKNFGEDLNVDSNVVYKEMVRDWRKQNREDMAKFRAKRSEKRTRERDSERTRRLEERGRPLRTKQNAQVASTVSGATPPGAESASQQAQSKK